MGEQRVTWAAAGWLAERLSDRDLAVLADVARVRLLTGRQIERLHFGQLEGRHRDRTRRRVLERLASAQLLTRLDRRIGGVRAGSAGLVFALGPAGQRVLALDTQQLAADRSRQPGTPTERFLHHNLVVAELYVALRELANVHALALLDFRAEPACWWRTDEGDWVKPDALAMVASGEIEDSWAIEVDMATESLPTLRRKLLTYITLAASGEAGPRSGPFPRVLLSVPHERRLTDVRALVAQLPDPAEQLFTTTLHGQAATVICQVLRE